MSDDSKAVTVLSDEEKRDKLRKAGYDPDKYRLLNSGAVNEIATNRIKDNLGVNGDRTGYLINSENAYEHHEKRRQLRISTMQAALEAETGGAGLGESLTILNRALVRSALQGSGIAKVKSMELIYRVLDLLDIGGSQGQAMPGGIDGASLAALRDIVQAARDMRAGDG